jgi:Peptidase family M28
MRIERSSARRLFLAAALGALALGASPARWTLSDEGRHALGFVSADSLRGHLSFLASDALGGRVTPSAGQDIAAEYIAAQFRRAGLEAIGDDAYFQTAPAIVAFPRAEGFRFSVALPTGTVDVAADAFQMTTVEPLSLDDVAIVKVPAGASADAASLIGRAVVTELEEIPAGPGRREAFGKRQRRLRDLAAANPEVVVALDRGPAAHGVYFETPALVDPPSDPQAPPRVVTIASGDFARAYDALPAGQGAGRLSLHVAVPARQATPLRNVAGLLRGSDPRLSQEYVLVSAHYDGTGPRAGATGPDRIWNGANDDGSGTVTLLELASAFSRMRPRPRRSVLFVAFFGEEKGLIGSGYYAAHPLVPLERTVADVNLEHLGRTDSTERNKAGTASLTGFDYSDVPAVFEAAGRATGVDVYKDEHRSGPFFLASDNYPLARAGVVAHTVCVLFEDFADYHGAGDEWPKIDYANMERTVRMVGAAVLMMADATQAPRWRDDVADAAPYRDAARKLQGR